MYRKLFKSLSKALLQRVYFIRDIELNKKCGVAVQHPESSYCSGLGKLASHRLTLDKMISSSDIKQLETKADIYHADWKEIKFKQMICN